ncbi:COX1 assembly protein Shy1, putative [Talaromyces stipitatus ATCC 10500]|uniref:SURF1-like protein n=1 Tax=Talaromyces stipitatus (strain ATCC 10500 / CBS 375.48 / QM 6759 / NRRL 1006) TaxID=441959 RepID=B8MMW4_TALSN|nr:COX1 assembly protein Shy1, putative [Talaromyces stipitatus ATCC 10500]EED13913.1 COX1 assembly protein Shy1, putative [Talaromyces stipitatus ATCC 10500]
MRPLFSSLSRATAYSSKSLQRGAQQQSQNSSIFDSVCLRCRRQQLQFLQFRQRQQRHFNTGNGRHLYQQPADDPQWVSPIDRPSQIVRVGRRHGPGLILLALIPITAFVLGTWQVQRLDWKTKLIAKFEDRLVKPPLPLPPRIDPDVIPEFDYRRIVATGEFRHDQEMLIGPRMHEGEEGYIVITPLQRTNTEESTKPGNETQNTVLINRGWISKKLKDQKDRPQGLPQGEVVVEGLLREPVKKNYFTPDNRPDKGEFYFPDVEQMAELTGSQPVLIEETMVPDLIESFDRTAKGIPIGRPAQVNLRNNHLQYIFTWYGLSLSTAIMLWMVVRKRPNEALRRVRQSRNM